MVTSWALSHSSLCFFWEWREKQSINLWLLHLHWTLEHSDSLIWAPWLTQRYSSGTSCVGTPRSLQIPSSQARRLWRAALEGRWSDTVHTYVFILTNACTETLLDKSELHISTGNSVSRHSWIYLGKVEFISPTKEKRLRILLLKESWSHSGHLHELFQARNVNAVNALHRRRPDILLDVSSVHKCQVNLLCHVGCCQDHNIGMSGSKKVINTSDTSRFTDLSKLIAEGDQRIVRRTSDIIRYRRKITLFPDRLIWSSWVSTELTTRMASEGSVPAWQAFLAAVRLSTCHQENSLIKKSAALHWALQEAHKNQKSLVKDFLHTLPHQSEQRREPLCHRWVVGSSETSLSPVYHSVIKKKTVSWNSK